MKEVICAIQVCVFSFFSLLLLPVYELGFEINASGHQNATRKCAEPLKVGQT